MSIDRIKEDLGNAFGEYFNLVAQENELTEVKEETKTYKNIRIADFDSYNERRYSDPWIGKYDVKNGYSFKGVGEYSGMRGKGEAGYLVVFSPVENTIYAYGQKDHRGRNSQTTLVVFRDGEFFKCNKFGELI